MVEVRKVFSCNLEDWLDHASFSLTKIFSTEKTLREQFVIRAFRGVILKSAHAIHRQLKVLSALPKEQMMFYERAQKVMLIAITDYEQEMYTLADRLDDLVDSIE